MLCPACHVALNRELLEGESIDQCTHCAGLWFDESELGRVVRRLAVPDDSCAEGTEATLGKPAIKQLACPECREVMARFNYAYDSGIFISKCQSCRGVWLAKGQLECIARYRTGTPKERSLNDALARDIGAANRWRSVREVIRSRWLSGIVASVDLLLGYFFMGGAEAMFRMAGFLVLPVACIWFSDGPGNLRGIGFGLLRARVTHTTPGDFVAIGGWILLLCPVIVALIARA